MNVICFLLGLSTVSSWLVVATDDVITFPGPPQPIAAHVGAKNVEVVCQQNVGSKYTLVEVKHRNPIGQMEKLLGKLDGLMPSEVASGYNLSVVKKADSKTITLTIYTVSLEDDGTIMCVATSESDAKDKLTALKDFVVIQKIETLHLQFQDKVPISSKPQDPMEVEAGLYKIRCIAEGSNPPTEDLKLFLNAQEVKTRGKPEIALMDGGVRKYKSTTEGYVTFAEKEAIHQLECLARDTSGNQLATELDIRILVPDMKEIICEVKANKLKTSVSLTCTVDHTRMNFSSVAFEIGKTGKILRSGDENIGSVITTHRVSSTKTNVTLTLDNPDNWHIESDFYLLFNTTDNHVTKEIYYMIRKELILGNSGSSSMAPVMYLTFFLTSLLWWRL